MANRARKNLEQPETPDMEAANETAADPEAETPTEAQADPATRTHKRCHDHPTNFPDEDALRPISEFYGKKAQMSYCRRCQAIRGKARREALKTTAAPTGLRAQLEETRRQLEAAESEVMSLRARLAEFEPDTTVPDTNE